MARTAVPDVDVEPKFCIFMDVFSLFLGWHKIRCRSTKPVEIKMQIENQDKMEKSVCSICFSARQNRKWHLYNTWKMGKNVRLTYYAAVEDDAEKTEIVARGEREKSTRNVQCIGTEWHGVAWYTICVSRVECMFTPANEHDNSL